MESSATPNTTALRTPPYQHQLPADLAATDATTPPPPPPGQRRLSPSPLHLSNYSLHDLLLLSPTPSAARRASRSRTVDESVEMANGGTTPRRRRRSSRGAAAAGAAPAASPRNARRARRRLDKEIEAEEDAARKVRRRKPARAAANRAAAEKEEDASLALAVAHANPIPGYSVGTDNAEQSGWESLWERMVELVMWKNVAKSALWFGFGSMFFLSSSFSREINFSPISALCYLGVVILGIAFLKDSVPQRQQVERGRRFQLTEEDVLRAARAVLPIANSTISTAQVIFSGDPSMTLKVLPVLLIGAKYGSLLTVWRLLATGFFTSFTLPKFYACYSSQIHRRVEGLRDQVLDAWKSCPRKKLIAATAVTICWNLVGVNTRIMAAFVSLVILRYNHQYRRVDVNSETEIGQGEQQQNMVIEG